MTDKEEKTNGKKNDRLNLELFGEEWVKSYIEGILFISESPVKTGTISESLDVPEGKIKQILRILEQEYIEQNRGFVLKKISGGYRLYSNPALNEVLQRFVKTNIRTHFSQAALETLAIISYRQPITRTQIAEIRGVRTDSVVLTLLDKGLLREAGKLREPGTPILKDLPPLKEFKEDEQTTGD